MKLLCPCGADRKDYTPEPCLASLKNCRGRRGACGGKACPWPVTAVQNKEWKEFWPGEELLPCVPRNRLPSWLSRSRFRLFISLLRHSRQARIPQPQSVVLAQAQAPPVPPVPPHAVHAPRKPAGHSSSYYSDSDEGQHFVISSGKNDSLTMSGTMGDGEHVEELRKTIPGDFIWFQRDGKSYIIRDQATVDRARGFWRPQEELGKKQEALGAQQEALGKQQEELGAKMEQIQVKVPDMTAELVKKVKTELKQLNSSATMEQVGEVQSAIGELQSKLGDLQSQAGDQQSKLGDKMGVLGEQQGKLGEQQGELGREQGEAAEQATREMKQLFDEAIAKGRALLEP